MPQIVQIIEIVVDLGDALLRFLDQTGDFLVVVLRIPLARICPTLSGRNGVNPAGTLGHVCVFNPAVGTNDLVNACHLSLAAVRTVLQRY